MHSSGFVKFKLKIRLREWLDLPEKSGFPSGTSVKELACQCKKCKRRGVNPSLKYGSGRSPRAGNGNPLQYSFLENPMDRGGWWATVHRVAKSGMSEVT